MITYEELMVTVDRMLTLAVGQQAEAELIRHFLAIKECVKAGHHYTYHAGEEQLVPVVSTSIHELKDIEELVLPDDFNLAEFAEATGNALVDTGDYRDTLMRNAEQFGCRRECYECSGHGVIGGDGMCLACDGVGATDINIW